MSKKTCYECENIMYQSMCSNTLCPIDNERFAEQCGGFTQIQKCPKTVFDTITASLEILAESSVYFEEEHTLVLEGSDCGVTFPGGWTSPFIEYTYGTKPEAIAATVEALKGVE